MSSQGSPHGSFSGDVLPKLTLVEREVLHLLTEELLTIKKAALRRQTSVRNIQKIAKKLREKGLLKGSSQSVRLIDGSSEPTNLNGIRLHGEQWLIKIIQRNDIYKEKIGKHIIIDGNTIRLHRDVICIYSTQSFFGSDTWASTAKSIDYWNTFFVKLENELKLMLVKPRTQNIERVKAEYAQIRNGLAIQCEREAEKIRIRTREDGKVWFTIDNSFNLREAETQHHETSQMDMQNVVEPQFNDLRDYARITGEMPPVPSQILSMLYEQARQSTEMNKHVLEIGAAFNVILKGPGVQQEAELPKDQRPLNDYFG